jgi:hypothetical protein
MRLCQASEPESEEPYPDQEKSKSMTQGLVSLPSCHSKESVHSFDLDVPPELCCPITRSIFHDPVVDSLGETYDRQAIEDYWASGVFRDPLSNQEVPDTRLVPNFAIRRIVQDFLEKNPKYIPDGWLSKEMAPAHFGAVSASRRSAEPTPPTLRRANNGASTDLCSCLCLLALLLSVFIVCFLAQFADDASPLQSGVFRSLPTNIAPERFLHHFHSH